MTDIIKSHVSEFIRKQPPGTYQDHTGYAMLTISKDKHYYYAFYVLYKSGFIYRYSKLEIEMIKQTRNGTLCGWEIPEAGISIHNHIHYPGEWLWTCREINVHGQRLCDQGLSEKTVLKHLKNMLSIQEKSISEKIEVINKMIE